MVLLIDASIKSALLFKKSMFLSPFGFYIFPCGRIRFWRGLDDPMLTYCGNVKLRAGINKISMLSVAVGFPVSFLHPASLFYGIRN